MNRSIGFELPNGRAAQRGGHRCVLSAPALRSNARNSRGIDRCAILGPNFVAR
jgi:hypothetical protein